MMTRINELNDIIFSLENELELAKDKLALYADEVNQLKTRKLEEDLDNANWQISSYSSENDELKAEVRFYSREATRLDDTVKALTADYEDLRMKHSALRNQNAALMAENEKFKNGYGISELVDENSDLINSIVKARNILDNAIS